MDSATLVSMTSPIQSLNLHKYWYHVYYLGNVLTFVITILYLVTVILDGYGALFPPLTVAAVLTIIGSFIMLRGLKAPIERSSEPPILKQIKAHYISLMVLGTVWMSFFIGISISSARALRGCYNCNINITARYLRVTVIVLCGIVFMDSMCLKRRTKEDERKHKARATGEGSRRGGPNLPGIPSSRNDDPEPGFENPSYGTIRL